MDGWMDGLVLCEEEEDINVLILSYPQYCRYRSMRKRIQGKPSSVQADQFVLALGGVAAISQRSQILYCRDTFEHPTLVENESVCDEFGYPQRSPSMFRNGSLQVLCTMNTGRALGAPGWALLRMQLLHFQERPFTSFVKALFGTLCTTSP
ncbi:AT-rich interactive domain-containing protein 5B, partial [Ophiophagus hannah]